tara:strand:+ start:49 stop:165 length:117 start_codon:yes stop_codon:yes gene_type:complete
MIKKIILISVISVFLFSCGKKEDLKYKANKSDFFIIRI